MNFVIDSFIAICPCCKSNSEPAFKKGDVQYFLCKKCITLFVPGGLPNDNMVGGGKEYERNTTQNDERLLRFAKYTDGSILDFGCGHGMLVNQARKEYFDIDGYDKYNPEFILPKEKKYDLVSMIEVIEHLSEPFEELDFINALLNKDGIVYIETSFTDVAKEENIPLDEFFYVSPEVGHCTIFSHAGLDMVMKEHGFEAMDHINRNTRIYKKC